MPRIITYDVEIATRVEDHPKGWEGARAGECGVASVVLYDNETERYHVYDEHTISACIDHLNQAMLLVGFNNYGFDKPCLEGYTNKQITPFNYDILIAVKQALHKPMIKGAYGLDPICQRTLNIGKPAHMDGARAPDLYAQSRWGELIDYNINDVHLTRRLYNHIIDFGYIIDADGHKLPIVRDKFKHEHA